MKKKQAKLAQIIKEKVGIIGLILGVCVLLITGYIVKDKQPQISQVPVVNGQAFQTYAAEIVKKCSEVKYHPGCYDQEIPKLMDPPVNLSMEDSFKVTSIVQDMDKNYRYCHVLGHELSAREVRKDPSKWKEIVSRCPSGVCSNGCIHGGFQERFRAEYLTDSQVEIIKPDLLDLCEERSNWHPTGLEKGSCYHAVGHLAMYLTNAQIDKSIKLCDEIARPRSDGDYRQICYDGVFMQIYQPLEPEDFALVKGKQPTKEQVASFCTKYDVVQKNSCWSESWPLFIEDLKKPEGLVAFCSQPDITDHDRCYMALFYVLTAQFGFDTDKIEVFCAGLPDQKRGACFANASSRLIETDYRNIKESIALCAKAQKYGKDGECYSELVKYSTYNFHANSSQALTLCNNLPDPWKTQCLKQSQASGSVPYTTD